MPNITCRTVIVIVPRSRIPRQGIFYRLRIKNIQAHWRISRIGAHALRIPAQSTPHSALIIHRVILEGTHASFIVRKCERQR